MAEGQERRVLVTGFEPFGGRTTNASWAAVDELRRSWTGPGLSTATLPVSFIGARRSLRALVAEQRPDVVVLVGEAERVAIGLERVAVNLIDARIPDNDGSAPVDRPVVTGAPAAYFSTLPLRACLGAVAATGLPVELSETAGTYVCNATFYALMHQLASAPEVRAGLVHVPLADEHRPGGPFLATTDAARALEVIAATALNVPPAHPVGGASYR